jgi:PIN domain nuclease of toxin-antitoxin system
MTVVLDASAVLAVLNSEPGGDKVSGHLSGGLMSAVNAVEVGTRLVDAGMTPDIANEAIDLLGMTIVDFDGELAAVATALRPATRKAGLSLADRACLALAVRENLPAITADQLWSSVDVGVKVEMIR